MFPFILIYILQLCQCQDSEVKYVINLDSQLEPCEDASAAFVDTSTVQVERFNETISYMFGDIEFLQDIGPNTMLEILVEKEASGKYEVMFTHEIWDFCDEVSMGPESDYHKYLKYFGLPEKCPFEAAKYPIKEMVIDTQDLPVNSNTCGRYRAFLNLFDVPNKESKDEKEFMCCLYFKLIIEME